MKKVEFNLKNYLQNNIKEEARMIIESEAKTTEEMEIVLEQIHKGIEMCDDIHDYISPSYTDDYDSWLDSVQQVRNNIRNLEKLEELKQTEVFNKIKDFLRNNSDEKLMEIRNLIHKDYHHQIEIYQFSRREKMCVMD